jgi:hypothetical protein
MKLSEILDGVIASNYSGLALLTGDRGQLLDYISNAQRDIAKLLILVKSIKAFGDYGAIQKCKEFLSNTDAAIEKAANGLYHMKAELFQAKLPLYDLITAVQVLQLQKYPLPKVVKDAFSTFDVEDEGDKIIYLHRVMGLRLMTKDYLPRSAAGLRFGMI